MAEIVGYNVDVRWRKNDDDDEPIHHDEFTVPNLDDAYAEVKRRHPNDREIWSVTVYPLVQCACGDEIACISTWVNPCDNCENEYDRNGYLLAPREQWGEETGERF